jgi:hypothetical protein
MTRRIAVALLTLATLALAGCRSDVTTIRSLLDDPSRFDGQTVRIAGEVKQGIGVLGYGAYEVDDGTGTLKVLTQGGGAPRVGARVGVEGEFKALFTLGDRSEAVLMEKQRFDAPGSGS